jgi:hypothetical protein
MVAVLTALVPVLAVLFEWAALYSIIPFLQQYCPTQVPFLLGRRFRTICLSDNTYREIIKDTEDFEGDAAYGKKYYAGLDRIRLQK